MPFYYKHVRKKRCNLFILNIILKFENNVLIIHFENIFRMYLKYVLNMPLLHNIFLNIFLLQMLAKIYEKCHLQTVLCAIWFFCPSHTHLSMLLNFMTIFVVFSWLGLVV
jgi:hypothetical protein